MDEQASVPGGFLFVQKAQKGGEMAGCYELVDLQLSGGFGRCPQLRAAVTLRCPDGREETRVCFDGVGMIDCAIKAVDLIVGEGAPRLGSFNAWVKRTESKFGSAAPGNCGLTLYSRGDSRGERVLGEAKDSDIVVASVRAYISGINRLRESQSKRELATAWAPIDR